MTHVFLDTNVLLDVLLRREPFVADSASVVDLGFKKQIELHASPLSFATCLFVARKSLGYTNAIEALKILERHIHIATMDASQLHKALHTEAPDFEDMLQYNAAQGAACECIITRNKQHFPQESIAVLTPTEFLHSLQNA